MPVPRPERSLAIGICAPSGRVDAAMMRRARAWLSARGHRVVVAPQVASTWRYFAGRDHERLAAFHALVRDPAIDVVMAARGGYGWTRLLGQVDWRAVRASRKVFVGFSDFTAFNLAALARAGLVTLHGPLAAADFGAGHVDPYTDANFWPVLEGRPHRIEVAGSTGVRPAEVRGVLWGGNLALIAHLVGTAYLPRVEGGLLFLEDVGEQPYAVERMLFQLHHAGILSRQRAILVGDFSHCLPTNTGRYPYSMQETLETLRALVRVPVLTGLPFGHVAAKVTLPVGARAGLSIRRDGYRLDIPGYSRR
jgi:muramoyltetrapeptide carboxypeptidase